MDLLSSTLDKSYILEILDSERIIVGLELPSLYFREVREVNNRINCAII